jgi:hypothetical protein
MACAKKNRFSPSDVLPAYSVQPPVGRLDREFVPCRNNLSFILAGDDGRLHATVSYEPALSWRFRTEPRLEVLEERPDGTLVVAFGPEMAEAVAETLGARPRVSTPREDPDALGYDPARAVARPKSRPAVQAGQYPPPPNPPAPCWVDRLGLAVVA